MSYFYPDKNYINKSYLEIIQSLRLWIWNNNLLIRGKCWYSGWQRQDLFHWEVNDQCCIQLLLLLPCICDPKCKASCNVFYLIGKKVGKILASGSNFCRLKFMPTILFPTKILTSFVFYHYFRWKTKISAGVYYCRLFLYRLTFLPAIIYADVFIDKASLTVL